MYHFQISHFTDEESFVFLYVGAKCKFLKYMYFIIQNGYMYVNVMNIKT